MSRTRGFCFDTFFTSPMNHQLGKLCLYWSLSFSRTRDKRPPSPPSRPVVVRDRFSTNSLFLFFHRAASVVRICALRIHYLRVILRRPIWRSRWRWRPALRGHRISTQICTWVSMRRRRGTMFSQENVRRSAYHIIPYHTIPYHIISYRIILYRTLSYHTILNQTISYHTSSYHITSCHIDVFIC